MEGESEHESEDELDEGSGTYALVDGAPMGIDLSIFRDRGLSGDEGEDMKVIFRFVDTDNFDLCLIVGGPNNGSQRPTEFVQLLGEELGQIIMHFTRRGGSPPSAAAAAAAVLPCLLGCLTRGNDADGPGGPSPQTMTLGEAREHALSEQRVKGYTFQHSLRSNGERDLDDGQVVQVWFKSAVAVSPPGAHQNWSYVLVDGAAAAGPPEAEADAEPAQRGALASGSDLPRTASVAPIPFDQFEPWVVGISAERRQALATQVRRSADRLAAPRTAVHCHVSRPQLLTRVTFDLHSSASSCPSASWSTSRQVTLMLELVLLLLLLLVLELVLELVLLLLLALLMLLLVQLVLLLVLTLSLLPVAAEPFEAVLAKRAEALEAVFAAREASKVRNTNLLWSAADPTLPSPLSCYGPLTVGGGLLHARRFQGPDHRFGRGRRGRGYD